MRTPSCQRRVADTYIDQRRWGEKAALNIARIGRFSSDRTIREYADDIWGIDPIRVELTK